MLSNYLGDGKKEKEMAILNKDEKY